MNSGSISPFCPACEFEFSYMGSRGVRAIPGDYLLCPQCLRMLQCRGADNFLVLLTDEELLALSPSFRAAIAYEIKKAQKAKQEGRMLVSVKASPLEEFES